MTAKTTTTEDILATADRALYAERTRVVDLEKRLAAAEARCKEMERALGEIADETHGHALHATSCLRDLNPCFRCIARAALEVPRD